jgi:ribosomal protein S18 acetylase RimI-like enzyme
VEIKLLAAGDDDLILDASHLFDGPAIRTATSRFLSAGGHHLFIAFEDGRAAGFISGVEVTHPDKGTEMFIYELGVDEPYRRRGIARALIDALKNLAIELGCYGMWVLTSEDNDAALAAYASTDGTPEPGQVVITWEFSPDD